MTKRYISTSERATVLVQGLGHLARMLDSPDRNNEYKDLWNEWCMIWGPQMKQRVLDIHEQNFIWASNFKED